ncbi:MAG: phosphatase, partial [Actinobacteria bacterium]|nr:phosphatase [Actinomycetota bacterium]
MTSRRIDLHLHSTCSDGVESPTRVMEVAKE